MPVRPNRHLIIIFTALLLLSFRYAHAEQIVQPEAMLDMDMQQLMNLTVTSAGKRHEKYYSTAAAVYVITNDAIRRSGATSIPEALRLAPGVEVQHVNANQISIGIRGQNDVFSDKLLVLMDGRALYTPTFSGTWWLVQNYPLEDIDRIEVIRGPSGAVWGSNAVNGVINIITKNARNTLGLMVSAGVGTEEKGFGSLRYGWRTKHANFRVYSMLENRDGGIYDPMVANIWGLPQTGDTPDYRKFGQAGFRMDWDPSHLTQVSMLGNFYRLKAGSFGYLAEPAQAATPHISNDQYSGSNVLLRVEHELPADFHMSAQFYVDRYKMTVPALGETRDTFDTELQLDFPGFLRQSLSIGGGYRLSRSDINETAAFQMADKSTRLFSLFVQDDINLIEDMLKLTAGLKMERNQYSGWEFQPSVRAILSYDTWSLWSAASRSVRTPNMIDNRISFNVKSGPGYVGRLFGDGRMLPEQVTAYEAGLRFYPNQDLLFQATVFKMFYKQVADVHQNAAAAFVENFYMVIPVYLQNILAGRARGIELDMTWQATDWLKLTGSFTHQRSYYMPTPINDAETRYSAYAIREQTPENRYHLRAGIDPGYGLELDVLFSHWDRFRQDRVKRYNRLDVRIGWKPEDNLEFSLVGKNLLKATHKEDLEATLEASSLQQQSYLFKVTYRR